MTHRSPKRKNRSIRHKIENQQAFVSIEDNSFPSSAEKSVSIVASSLIQEFFDPSNTFRIESFYKESGGEESIDEFHILRRVKRSG